MCFGILLFAVSNSDDNAHEIVHAMLLSFKPRYSRLQAILNVSLLYTILFVSQNVGEEVNILERLFPNFYGHRRSGYDVWSEMVVIPPLFWHLTGETPETFEALYQALAPLIVQPRDPRL